MAQAIQTVSVQQGASFTVGHRKYLFITRHGQFHKPASDTISDECELYLVNLYDAELLNESEGFSDFWCGHNTSVAVEQCNAYFKGKVEFTIAGAHNA